MTTKFAQDFSLRGVSRAWGASVLFVLMAMPGWATPVQVDYFGNNGVAAEATFDLLDGGSTLQIVLKNTSVAPFAGGGANMVLSSINFDLGTIDIIGGNVGLAGGSDVVIRSGAVWAPEVAPNLNVEYGYSNTGIGNAAPPGLGGADNSVTSHSNGGNHVTTFHGDVGGVGGGLDFGLVGATSSPFGNNKFILDCVDLRLTLSAPLLNLSFLQGGSYVEFGSDFAFIPNVVPEPTTWALLVLGAAALPVWRRRLARTASR